MFRKAARILIAVMLIATAHAALAEKRVALVIGNDKYVNLASHAQLERAVNDARAVSRAFTDLGFEVTEAEDVSRSAFNAKWQQFLLKVADGDIVAFYFSGHGIEVEGLNFLIPSDIPNVEYGRQEQIKRELISVSELLLDLKKRRPGVSLLILDACREHPMIPDEFRFLARNQVAWQRWTRPMAPSSCTPPQRVRPPSTGFRPRSPIPIPIPLTRVHAQAASPHAPEGH